jgi:hypothetical protein
MKTSQYWQQHYAENLKKQRINWELAPSITPQQKKVILASLQAWQLGETSDGKHLIAASKIHAEKTNDPAFLEAIQLFIKEEQKHGENLGKYLDRINEPRIKSDWGDELFRRVRYFNTNMELWTLAVITVESTAQVFYQSLKDATQCKLLKQICTDILIDEAYHISFQFERLSIITANRSCISKFLRYWIYALFYFSTITLVYVAHRKLFRAGGNNYNRYFRKMKLKFDKTIKRLFRPTTHVYQSKLKWEQIEL